MPIQLDLFNDGNLLCPFNSGCVQMDGFSVLPAGNYNGEDRKFNNLGSNANFWSSTENNSDNAYNLNINDNDANINNKNNANSIRCLQDSGPGLSRDFLCNELLHCYYEARRHKRNTYNQLKFEVNLEQNLMSLSQVLYDRTYELSPAICFINEKPVKREIIAADFRDRVVHHLLYRWLYPIFDRQFIYDSYSCRVGKGTLFGINRAKGFIRATSEDFRKECFVLRLDVSGFFMGINRQKLYELIIEGLNHARWNNIPDKNLAMYLVKKIVFHNPLEKVLYKSSLESWKDLPQIKSLKFAALGCGLPIGNLTSQLFGNIYMNPLDHFVKRVLKVKYYGRYVDDMVLVHWNRDFLRNCMKQIKAFLKQELMLTLHPNKVYLQPIQNGFPFLGAFVLPWRTYPGRRVVCNFKECLCGFTSDCNLRNSKIQSYTGLLKHFNACSLLNTVKKGFSNV